VLVIPHDERKFELVSIGESMALVVPVTPQPLRTAEVFSVSVGGAESTVALYLAEAGLKTAWASRVGDDPLGARIVDHLKRHCVSTCWVEQDSQAPTGVYFKDPGGAVHYYRSGSAASRMTPDWLSAVDFTAARMVHLTGITPALSHTCAATVDAAITRAQAAGTPVSVDVNYRPGLWSREAASPVLLELIRRADVILVGRDEAGALWGCRTPAEVHDHVGAGPVVVVKDGAHGATEYLDDGETFVEAQRVSVVEEVGAGDAFAAGYLTGWLKGLDATNRLAYGHRNAARALTGMDDFVPIRDHQLTDRIDANLEQA